jgi:UDP-glucuronate 4-epimerase
MQHNPAPSKVALVTGCSGFIGYHLCARLLAAGWQVIGVDSLSDYYDVSLKRRRQDMLAAHDGFQVINAAIETPNLLMDLFKTHRPAAVFHLAAQAGVRHSIDAPRSYLTSNIVGTFELLEAARVYPPQHILLASTSSIYGANTAMPYRETDAADHQVSFYAASKKAVEMMAHSYAHLYHLPITAFRFFTVYGPWSRPDMAPMKFAKAILANEPIDVYNHGEMRRDFTFVDDLIEAVMRLILAVPQRPAAGAVPVAGDSLSPVAPFRVVNIGNSRPVPLLDFIAAMERALGAKAQLNLLPMQAGDVAATWADTRLLQALTGYAPSTDLDTGLAAFANWYRGYRKNA